MHKEEAIRVRYDRAVRVDTPQALIESWSDMPALFKALDGARAPMLQQLAGLLLDACERAEACAGQAVGSDSIRAVCGTMELLENNERYIGWARQVSFAGACGDLAHARKQAVSLGNVLHGREWWRGDGRPTKPQPTTVEPRQRWLLSTGTEFVVMRCDGKNAYAAGNGSFTTISGLLESGYCVGVVPEAAPRTE